ncbi:hypothetical protein A6A08_17050 [Nocardiopsis sp. TSRI0078]|uniref:hypothetical protein n=1 Tax=unclassified Nocardiopsis TaxID=2649073 RepID=UPI0009391709|nr:hypothetical protein [Nocardiopsis sp. TSRI0078]OKI12278.1 hypothetical protein A6A08_17050 [Nocardiopsis sp. TSRI0078]
MSPVQIVRTVATALIAGGVTLGLVPGGSCGAGWWAPSGVGDSFGWFAYTEMPPPAMVSGVCGTAMAPVGSWAIALVVVGATLLAGVWINTSYPPKDMSEK